VVYFYVYTSIKVENHLVLLSAIEEKSKLEKIINVKRKELIKTGMQEGLQSKRTLIISQQLDIFIVKYQKLL
jgi:hypothetical protein